MPRVLPDHELSRLMEEYVHSRHNGVKARASDALSITRPVLYRALRGSVTKATGDDLRAKLGKEGVGAPATSSAGATKTEGQTGTPHDIPTIALQVLRFITQAVQHERLPDWTSTGA
jgi:hypothetical protein